MLICNTKWVITNKLLDNDGTLEPGKARWTFTATVKAKCIRTSFLLVVLSGPEVNWIGAVKAFTQAMLSGTDLYCKHMEGFEDYDETTREKLAFDSKMALEGERQSEPLWQQADTKFLKACGFTQCWYEMHLHSQTQQLVSSCRR
eukprot:2649594-Pleurochrysis_carterae.AAC.1